MTYDIWNKSLSGLIVKKHPMMSLCGSVQHVLGESLEKSFVDMRQYDFSKSVRLLKLSISKQSLNDVRIEQEKYLN